MHNCNGMTTMSESEDSYPVGSSVLLRGLKSAEYNGKRGIVKTSLADGRQEVRVLDGINKSIRVKLINLSYEPREISSLSVPDLRGCLTLSGVSEKNQPPDKDDLRKMLGDIVGSPEEVARLVAKANEPSDPPPRKTSRTAAGGRSNGADTNINLDGTNTSALREGAERMAAMDPAQLKQQAAAMRAMGPAGMRATNPAMANMSDVQIWQAINQMEQVANNPAMMQAATEQMKNMSESDLQQAMRMGVGGGGMATTPQAPSTGSDGGSPLDNISSDQFRQATMSMDPSVLKANAAAMKGMSADEIRRRNPQMANFTDAQITQSIAQMEMMAQNPEMMKVVQQQMQDMTPEQFEQMKGMMASGSVPGASTMTGAAGGDAGGSSSSSSAASPAAFPGGLDPSAMAKSMLTNPEQFNSTVRMLKSNPGLIKTSISSMAGDDPAKREQIERQVEAFAQMDDAKLERYLKMANTAQRFVSPFVGAFDRVMGATGLSFKGMIVMLNVAFVGCAVLLGIWYRSRSSAAEGDMFDDDVLAGRDVMPDMVPENYDSEF